jgi:hypothetical protein
MQTTRTRRLGLLGTAGSMALTSLAVVAMPTAAAEVERERHGNCTRTSDWELELEKEHGRIEVKVDLDTNRSGRAWQVRLWHNGSLTTSVVRRTQRDGDLEVERIRTDRRGTDTFRFRAVDRVNGEVCTGSLSI